MAATPQYGTFFLRAGNGTTRAVDIYLSDVANALVKFDSGAGSSSGSDSFYTIPTDCILEDYSQVTGTADTTKLAITRNNVQTGNILRYAVHLTTLNQRPKLAIPFKAGDKLGSIQLA